MKDERLAAVCGVVNMAGSRLRAAIPAGIVVVLLVAGLLWWSGILPFGSTIGGENLSPNPKDVPSCGPRWRLVESPNPSPDYDELHAVAVAPGGTAWAAGTFGTEDFAKSFVVHWDGKTWKQVPSPSVADYSNHPFAVAALADDDAWVVGASHRGTDVYHTLTMHWDGTSWKIVPSPSPAQISSLNGVAAIATDDVWAVGELSNASKGTGSQPLLMHWDGSAWNLVPAPANSPQGPLNGVMALNKNDIWAVGSSPRGGSSIPLTMHWDGANWSAVPAPGAGELWSVAGSSASDIWAVGVSSSKPSALHWDGKAWSEASMPDMGSDAGNLNAVAVSNDREAWAVGSVNGRQTLVVEWDGKTWSRKPSPSTADYDELKGAAAAGPGDFWAVGSYIDNPALGTNFSLAERHNDPCASRTPAP